MTTMTVRSAEHATRHAAASTRVAVRQVREASFRALIAAGASGGEAAAAAELVTTTEIHFGAGLAALLEELPRVPRDKIGIACHGDHPAILADPAARGPLLLLPPAVDMTLTGRAVFLPGLRWYAIVQAALSSAAEHHSTTLAAVAVSNAGTIVGAALASPDGSVDWPANEHLSTCGVLPGWSGITPVLESLPAGRPGLLLTTLTTEPDHVCRYPIAEQQRRMGTALREGTEVDAVTWSAAYAASRAFLVPEA